MTHVVHDLVDQVVGPTKCVYVVQLLTPPEMLHYYRKHQCFHN